MRNQDPIKAYQRNKNETFVIKKKGKKEEIFDIHRQLFEYSIDQIKFAL